MSILLKVLEKQRTVSVYTKEFVVACLGSIVISLSAPLSVHLPFTVVPITAQVHVALLVAFFLGKRAGPLAIGLFFLQGALGYPVFAGGVFGFANMLGPRGGYLVGYFIAALVMGGNRAKTLPQMFAVLAGANLVVYLFGFVWLSTFIGGYKALTLGVLPFIIGDFLKLVLASKLAFASRSKFSLR